MLQWNYESVRFGVFGVRLRLSRTPIVSVIWTCAQLESPLQRFSQCKRCRLADCLLHQLEAVAHGLSVRWQELTHPLASVTVS